MKKLMLNKKTISRLDNLEMNVMGASGVCYTIDRSCICQIERTGFIACGIISPKTMPCKVFTWHTDPKPWEIISQEYEQFELWKR